MIRFVRAGDKVFVWLPTKGVAVRVTVSISRAGWFGFSAIVGGKIVFDFLTLDQYGQRWWMPADVYNSPALATLAAWAKHQETWPKLGRTPSTTRRTSIRMPAIVDKWAESTLGL